MGSGPDSDHAVLRAIDPHQARLPRAFLGAPGPCVHTRGAPVPPSPTTGVNRLYASVGLGHTTQAHLCPYILFIHPSRPTLTQVSPEISGQERMAAWLAARRTPGHDSISPFPRVRTLGRRELLGRKSFCLLGTYMRAFLGARLCTRNYIGWSTPDLPVRTTCCIAPTLPTGQSHNPLNMHPYGTEVTGHATG